MNIRLSKIKIIKGLVIPWHPTLVELVCWYCGRYNFPRFTCGYEERNYLSVHSTNPLRGLDAGIKDFNDPKIIADDINRHWIYDPTRPKYKCCVYGDKDHLDHFHLQVCNKTGRV